MPKGYDRDNKIKAQDEENTVEVELTTEEAIEEALKSHCEVLVYHGRSFVLISEAVNALADIFEVVE